MQRDGRGRLGRKGVHASLDHIEGVLAKVARCQGHRGGMVLVGEHREPNSGRAQAPEHLDRAGIGRRVVLAVLCIVGAELGIGTRKGIRIACELRRHKALDQLGHTVSHLVAVRVHGKGRPAVGCAHVVAGACQVFQRVEHGAVHIKDHVRKSHDASRLGMRGRIAWTVVRPVT